MTGSTVPPCLARWKREETRRFQRLLLRWYGRQRRVLPWREDPDPYKVWISEVMLQQTQVQTVLPYFERFTRRFPDIHSLAGASEEEVVDEWAGLGYYGRARNLRRAAGIIEREHGGRIPADMRALRELPGIGRYTAGAILSIAYNQPFPAVDGNVRRVVARLHGIEGKVPDEFYWSQAESWVPEKSAAEFNQAVMELGALVCVPSSPECPVCPVQSLCEARRLGIQNRIPPARKTRARSSVALVMLVPQRGSEFLLVRHREPEYIPGGWGLPTAVLEPDEPPGAAAARLARRLVGSGVRAEKRATIRHAITFRQIRIHVYHLKLNGGRKTPAGEDRRWASGPALIRLLTSSAFRKALRRGAVDAPATLPDRVRL